jgi:hypothetical protein
MVTIIGGPVVPSCQSNAKLRKYTVPNDEKQNPEYDYDAANCKPWNPMPKQFHQEWHHNKKLENRKRRSSQRGGDNPQPPGNRVRSVRHFPDG